MSGGFEKAFQAFLESQQNTPPISDENNNTDDEEDSNEECYSSDSDEVPFTKKRSSSVAMTSTPTVPILKLKVHPDYTADKGYSPFSLKHYIKSPSNDVKLISYDRGVHTANNYHQFNGRQSPSETYLKDSTYKTNNSAEKLNSSNKLKSTSKKHCRFTDMTKSKITYQKQILLKKYGISYPGQKSRNGLKSGPPSSPNLNQNIILSPLLAEDRLNSTVSKTECDSHYFCQQGEGLSRNSPEAAKSVISSPANVSAGENSLTDPCVSPAYDSVTEQTNVIFKSSDNSDLINFTSQPSVKNKRKMLNKTQNSGSSQLESSNTTNTVTSSCDSNNSLNKPKRKSRKNVNHSTKRKRNLSGYNSDPDYTVETEDERLTEVDTSRRKRLRQKQNTSSCLCCVNKSHRPAQSLRCNTSNYDHLPLPCQKFIFHSIQQSNIKSKLHSLFCCVFPKLIPFLHSVTPESHAFNQLIDDMLVILQSSDEEMFNVNSGDVINLLQEMDLKTKSDIIPVFQPSVILCDNPEICFLSFRDKVVHLLQLLLPSLVVSLDDFLSTSEELDMFLDKVISSNSV